MLDLADNVGREKPGTLRSLLWTVFALFVTSVSPRLHAQDAGAPDQLAQRVTELENANKVAVARYGSAATPPTGTVSDPANLARLTSILQRTAYDKIAEAIKEKADILDDDVVLITSARDFGARAHTARIIQTQISELVVEGNSFRETPPNVEALSDPVTITGIMAMAGALDSLVGLFRSDYTISSADAEKNILGLHLALQSQFGARASIDGLDLNVVEEDGFSASLTELGKLRAEVASRQPKEKSREAVFVAAATTVLGTMRTAGADGISPAARISLMLRQIGQKNPVIIYADVVSMSASVVSTKRLFSRNAVVHLYLTGLINAAVGRTDGSLFALPSLRVGEGASLDLGDLKKPSAAKISIATDTRTKANDADCAEETANEEE